MPSSATTPDWPGLLDLAVSQAGHFTTAQAAALGFSPELLIHHTRAGRLIRVHRGIYRVSHLPSADDEDLVVLWLWTDRRGVMSHRTALALHDLSDVLPSVIDVTLPAAEAGRRRRVPNGVILHFGDIPDDERAWVGHVPVTSVIRTLWDCKALPLSPELLTQATSDAGARGLVPRPVLRRLRAVHA